jgi:D-arabinose 1-dehydrogenase-like Zn-dependent alcohol dehydrogenase
MSQLIHGLRPDGKLMVVGVDFEPIEVTPVQLIVGSGTIQDWNTGMPIAAEDTLNFAELTGVRPWLKRIRSKKRPRLMHE